MQVINANEGTMHMSTEHERGGSPSRRALVRGAAWTTPVVVMTAPLAAAATSPACATSVSVVSRCRTVILIFPFRQYTVCFTNDCPPGSPPVTVSNVTVSGTGDTDTLPGSVTLGPGESGCIEGSWEVVGPAPGTVTVSYTVSGGTGNSPQAGLSVASCGTTANNALASRSASASPPDGTTVTLEDGRKLMVKDGQLVDESGLVITSEEDLRAPAPKTSQPEAPASAPGSGETDVTERTIAPSATPEADASTPEADASSSSE